MWTFLSFLQIRTRKINSDSWMSVRVCVSARSVSAAARCLCRRSRVSCGWRRMGRSRGRSVTSSSGLQESTMSPKAKPRSVRLKQTSHGTQNDKMKMQKRNVGQGYENQIHQVYWHFLFEHRNATCLFSFNQGRFVVHMCSIFNTIILQSQFCVS